VRERDRRGARAAARCPSTLSLRRCVQIGTKTHAHGPDMSRRRVAFLNIVAWCASEIFSLFRRVSAESIWQSLTTLFLLHALTFGHSRFFAYVKEQRTGVTPPHTP
jgi:hypothetical protein